MILIVGSSLDPHIISVIHHIELSGCDYVLLDRAHLNAGSVELKFGERSVLQVGSGSVSGDFKAIWWRQKPPFTIPSENVSDYYDCVFAMQEWTHVQRYLEMKFYDVFAINNPVKATSANNKLFQLELAQQTGFKIPRTLISNNYAAVDQFLATISPNEAIFKTLNAYTNPVGLYTYTTLINRDLIAQKKSAVGIAPGIYQEYIEKVIELRVTVVGDKIFTAKINSSASDTAIDWRSDQHNYVYEIYNPDESFKKQLYKLHKLFGLFYGAYDFIIDRNNEYVFLEVNPFGQWLWLEEKLDFPISLEIASALIVNSIENKNH